MICLDSDFIILYLKGDAAASNKLDELLQRGEAIVTTAINSLEIFVGIVEVDGISGKRVELTRHFIDSLTILPFTHTAAEKAAYILNTLKQSGRPIGLKDSLIAGIIQQQDVTLLTRNIKHFSQVAGLRIETW